MLGPDASMHADVLLGGRETLAFASMVSSDLDSDAVLEEKLDWMPRGMQVTLRGRYVDLAMGAVASYTMVSFTHCARNVLRTGGGELAEVEPRPDDAVVRDRKGGQEIVEPVYLRRLVCLHEEEPLTEERVGVVRGEAGKLLGGREGRTAPEEARGTTPGGPSPDEARDLRRPRLRPSRTPRSPRDCTFCLLPRWALSLHKRPRPLPTSLAPRSPDD